jgi:hypothetical protein
MSIIQPIQKEKTKDDRILEIVNEVLQVNAQNYYQIVNNVNMAFNKIWGIGYGMDMVPMNKDIKPSEIINKMNELGIDTVKLFTSSKMIQDLLEYLSSDTESPYQRLVPPQEFKVVDGKIELIEPVPVEETPAEQPVETQPVQPETTEFI